MTEEGIKAKLEQAIIGKTCPAFSCCCGAVSFPAAVAIGVRRDYVAPGAHTLPRHWSVQMRSLEKSEGEYDYSQSLNSLLSKAEIEAIFQEQEN